MRKLPAVSCLLDLRDFRATAAFEKVLICGHMGPMRVLVGIVEETPSPADVLARSFDTEVVRLCWHRLMFPAYLRALN